MEPTDLSLTAWWENWVNTYKIKAVSESSLSSYDQSKKRFSKCAPTLLSTSISSLIRSGIQLAINNLSGQYSDDTAKQTYVHVSDCLKQAEMDRIIRQSPCIKISMPNRRDHDTKATAKTAEDVTSFINYCTQGPRTTLEGKIDLRDTQRYVYKAASLTILSAGFRRGEVCPLLWDDLSQDGLGINKALSDSGKLTTPKNDSSVVNS